MMNIFFLISQEMVTDIVERVRRKFVLPMHMNQQIELDSSFNIDIFGLSITHNFWL